MLASMTRLVPAISSRTGHGLVTGRKFEGHIRLLLRHCEIPYLAETIFHTALAVHKSIML